MEKGFDAKLSLHKKGGNNRDVPSSNGVQRSRSFAFRAPQEQFTVEDFELGKLYGTGSYSKKTKNGEKKESGRKSDRISRLASYLRAKRESSIIVRTGFPTSVVDLVVNSTSRS